MNPNFDTAQMKDLVDVVTFERGALICRQGAHDERSPHCIVASERAQKYVCRCRLGSATECSKLDHTPFLFTVLSGRVRATKKERHGQTGHKVSARSIRCGNPACKCALWRAKRNMQLQLKTLREEADVAVRRASVRNAHGHVGGHHGGHRHHTDASAAERAMRISQTRRAQEIILKEAIHRIEVQLKPKKISEKKLLANVVSLYLIPIWIPFLHFMRILLTI